MTISSCTIFKLISTHNFARTPVQPSSHRSPIDAVARLGAGDGGGPHRGVPPFKPAPDDTRASYTTASTRLRSGLRAAERQSFMTFQGIQTIIPDECHTNRTMSRKTVGKNYCRFTTEKSDRGEREKTSGLCLPVTEQG
ncbi:hypothetical protein EVAR_52094_1 [Eumeta japonica]|uniref:Uncharacterized protein n=1 Tax=Eumeta variegata TaxID=151549 RepID=A0A4C1XQ81_EUMVA|nr:hypothetical protein EVAR_52094_1 [Eumeta japonica]